MASNSGQSHNQNVVNFEELIVNCTTYGSAYNPNKSTLKIASMQAQLTAVKNCLSDVRVLDAAYRNAIAVRKTSFKTFDKLITRINNALNASDTTEEFNNSVKSLIRKLQGRRATPKKTEEEKQAAAQAGKEIVEISNSQMGFDDRLANFDKLIKLLSTVSAYAPNEADLKISALNATYNDLKTKNLTVINTQAALNPARINRSVLMYKDSTGLVDVAIDAKSYIKSVFGSTSPQYKAISNLRFVSYN